MKFDPFVDRLSRDIRNDLAATVTEMLTRSDLAPARDVAERYLEEDLEPCYRDYIDDRLARYRSALDVIRQGPDDVFWQALVLWDHQLFFEAHDVLEQAWYSAEGSEKQILQAMIRAAGVYIKLEYGYAEAASKMAARSLPVLQQHEKYLARYFNPEKLLHALRDCDPRPPSLLG